MFACLCTSELCGAIRDICYFVLCSFFPGFAYSSWGAGEALDTSLSFPKPASFSHSSKLALALSAPSP